jgi:hypothetical protein
MLQCLSTSGLQSRFSGNILTLAAQQAKHICFPRIGTTVCHLASRFTKRKQSFFDVGQ